MTMITREEASELDLSDIGTGEHLASVLPGDVLREEFLVPLELSVQVLAREINLPSIWINEISAGQRAISAEVAIRLSKRFGTTAEFWMHLQTAHDLEIARATMDRPS